LDTYLGTYVYFISAGVTDLSKEHCCATLTPPAQLTVSCSSTTHNEFVVVLPLQQLLG